MNPVDPSKLLQDYERTAAMLMECRETFRRLASHHRLVARALDTLTKPDGKNAEVRNAGFQAAGTPVSGYNYKGQVVQTRFAIDTYCGIIARLWNDFPDRRPAIQAALNSPTYLRRGIADSPEKLFPFRDAAWRRGKYQEVAANAFIDTNLSNKQKQERLHTLAARCGLKWGEDIAVFGL